MVQMEPAAAAALREYLEDSKIGLSVRIKVLGIGCMGAALSLVPGVPEDNDESETVQGVTFISGRQDVEQFGGYIITLVRSGIRIRTVNRVTGGCETCVNTLNGEGCH